MNYSDYHISINDFDITEKKVKSERILSIWEDIVNRIDDPVLKSEAEKKGFIIEDNPDIEDDVIANYMRFTIPNASKELIEYMEESLYPFLVLMKDE